MARRRLLMVLVQVSKYEKKTLKRRTFFSSKDAFLLISIGNSPIVLGLLCLHCFLCAWLNEIIKVLKEKQIKRSFYLSI